jgi:hypothetical protein
MSGCTQNNKIAPVNSETANKPEIMRGCSPNVFILIMA